MREWTACGVGVAAVSAIMAPPSASAADPKEEAQKQAARLISQAIAERISARTDLDADAAPSGREMAAWGITSYSALEAGADLASPFEVNLGLLSGGYDWGEGKLISGVNLSFNYFGGDFTQSDPGIPALSIPASTTDVEITGLGFAVSPYVAYKFTENFFVSGVLGINRSSVTTESDAFAALGGDTEMTFGATGIDGSVTANFVQSAGIVNFREKIGYRFGYSISDEAESLDDGTGSNAIGIGAEAELKLGQHMGIYLGAEGEYQIPTNYTIDPVTFEEEKEEARYPVYVTAGLNYRPSPGVQFGAGYQTEFGDDESDISTFIVSGRIKFRGGLRSADNRVTPVDNRVTPVDDYQSLYSPASEPAPPLPQQYQQPASAWGAQSGPPAPGQSALAPAPQQGFQPQYTQYQQPAAQTDLSQPVYQPAVAQSGASSVCQTRLDQNLQMRSQSGRRSPAEDAASFRAIYDDYDRCMAAAR